jgi:hypothetical protein
VKKPKKKFSKGQLTFVVECILSAVVDKIQDGTPVGCTYENRKEWTNNKPKALMSCERAALENAGMSLGIFYAQLTGDGLGVYDALTCAGNFDDACDNFMAASWKNKGNKIFEAEKICKDTKKQYRYDELLKPYGFPKARKHAKAFVKACFEEYLDNDAVTTGELC